MVFNQAKQGFTLIELLVVVLIIGILAAVALPQYQVAVLKSRAVQAITSLNALEKAQEVYKLANGVYASNLADLDIDVSGITDFNHAYAQKYINGHLFFEWVWVSTSFPKGEHRCIAYSAIAHKVCKSLGGEKIDHSNNTDTMTYYKIP